MFGSEVESIKALREATEVLTSQDPDRLFDDQLEHTVVELHRLRNSLDAVWYRHVAKLETRHTYLTQGYTSLAAWIAHRCGLAWGRAKHVIGIARNLTDMPRTQAAFAAGEVDVISVRQLVKARARNVELFGRDEEVLVDAARDLLPRDFSKALAYWVDAADAVAAAADAEELYERRRLYLSSTFQDMVRVDGELDPEWVRWCPRRWRRWSTRRTATATTPGRRRSDGPMRCSTSAATTSTTPTPPKPVAKSPTSH